MRDQETDREGNGLSIFGGPSLELNRSRSSQLSCLGDGIPSLVGFEGYKMWCGFISLDLFRFKGRAIEGIRLKISFFSMVGGFFRIKSVCVGEARKRQIGSRGDAYFTRYH
ncbi:uncharacterized protein DS421_8g229590 [Arachis hypogaea]|nr:uncharacterized protein DS421_8g229590 [Arachis hypogaea]